ncbi:alpha/beta hydrolase [bacterium]|nr:alpha/beta hydrolase [bacterium]
MNKYFTPINLNFAFLGCLLFSSCDSDKPPFPLGFGEERVYSNHVEIDVGFENEGAVLAGTLFLPNTPGPHPVMVHHFGSDRWKRLAYSDAIQANLDEGLALFFYDKRGVGDSQGDCCAWKDPDYFYLLAGDMASAVRLLRTHHKVDSNRIGLYGFSQGGWIVPIAAADTTLHIAWTVIGSGPTVSLGEEILYSELSGDDECKNSSMSDSAIYAVMDKNGPSGFNPRVSLERMKNPGIWVYGGLDRSIPVSRSIEILNDIKSSQLHDFTIILRPTWNHCWVVNGAPCDCEGIRGDQYFIFQWIKDHAGLQ